MSREMKIESVAAYRVIVTGNRGDVAYGPFATLSAARSAATREKWGGSGGWRLPVVPFPFRIQRTDSEWVNVA